MVVVVPTVARVVQLGEAVVMVEVVNLLLAIVAQILVRRP